MAVHTSNWLIMKPIGRGGGGAGGVAILLVASCYRNKINSGCMGHLDNECSFIFYTVSYIMLLYCLCLITQINYCCSFFSQLLKALPVLQQQIDALLEADVC